MLKDLLRSFRITLFKLFIAEGDQNYRIKLSARVEKYSQINQWKIGRATIPQGMSRKKQVQ